jgi:5-methylcytosine-specific restriction endonuclease McrA
MQNTCAFCGIEYTIKDNRKIGKFCSFSCSNKSKGAHLTKKCLTCGKEFIVVPSELSIRFFCSLKCCGLHKRKRVEKTCKSCGKKFSVSVSKNKKYKNCSIGCEIRHKIIKCIVCGNEFKVKNSHIHNRFCCSKACQNQNQRNQTGSKNNNWRNGATKKNAVGRNTVKYKEWMLEVFKRDHYTCQRCGIKNEKINAHHIKQWVSNKKLRYVTSNGITLCYECHKHIHGMMKKKNTILKKRKNKLKRIADAAELRFQNHIKQLTLEL